MSCLTASRLDVGISQQRSVSSSTLVQEHSGVLERWGRAGVLFLQCFGALRLEHARFMVAGRV